MSILPTCTLQISLHYLHVHLLTIFMFIPRSKTIESVLLRAEAYEEQREKLITKMSDQSETTQGKELELRRITKRIKDTRAELQTYRLAHEMIVGKRTNLK